MHDALVELQRLAAEDESRRKAFPKQAPAEPPPEELPAPGLEAPRLAPEHQLCLSALIDGMNRFVERRSLQKRAKQLRVAAAMRTVDEGTRLRHWKAPLEPTCGLWTPRVMEVVRRAPERL